MEQLNNASFERRIRPHDILIPSTLILFADASICAFKTCAYLRNECSSGEIDVKFVAANSRVVSLRKLTIPHLELQAAVLVNRLCKTIEREIVWSFKKVSCLPTLP